MNIGQEDIGNDFGFLQLLRQPIGNAVFQHRIVVNTALICRNVDRYQNSPAFSNIVSK